MRKANHDGLSAAVDHQPVSSGTRATSRVDLRGGKASYYEYYKKLYVINKLLEGKIRELVVEREDLNTKIAEVCLCHIQINEKNMVEQEAQRMKAAEVQNVMERRSESVFSNSEDDLKERKRRRRKEEIARDFVCHEKGCGKAYG